MEIIFLERNLELKKNKAELEKVLNVKITIGGRKVTIEGSALDEYEALRILEAIGTGFSAKEALSLKEEDMVFVRIPIKQVTNRKDMKTIKGRVIGTEGKTKRTLENVSGCKICIGEKEVGIIGPGDEIEETKTAVTNLIRGTKEANTYRFLERMNTERKNLNPNLDLKPFAKKENSKKDKED